MGLRTLPLLGGSRCHPSRRDRCRRAPLCRRSRGLWCSPSSEVSPTDVTQHPGVAPCVSNPREGSSSTTKYSERRTSCLFLFPTPAGRLPPGGGSGKRSKQEDEFPWRSLFAVTKRWACSEIEHSWHPGNTLSLESFTTGPLLPPGSGFLEFTKTLTMSPYNERKHKPPYCDRTNSVA